MRSAARGPSTFPVEVTNVSPHGFWLFVDDEELPADGADTVEFAVRRAQLRQRFARGLAGLQHSDAGLLLKFSGCHFAPRLVCAANGPNHLIWSQGDTGLKKQNQAEDFE